MRSGMLIACPMCGQPLPNRREAVDAHLARRHLWPLQLQIWRCQLLVTQVLARRAWQHPMVAAVRAEYQRRPVATIRSLVLWLLVVPVTALAGLGAVLHYWGQR